MSDFYRRHGLVYIPVLKKGGYLMCLAETVVPNDAHGLTPEFLNVFYLKWQKGGLQM